MISLAFRPSLLFWNALVTLSAGDDFLDHELFTAQDFPFAAATARTGVMMFDQIEHFATALADRIAGQNLDFQFCIL